MDKKTVMMRLVRKWKTSGMTRESFARGHGVSVHTLEYWSRKFKNEDGHLTSDSDLTIKPSPAPSFIEIVNNSTGGTTSGQAQIELELPSGIRLKIY